MLEKKAFGEELERILKFWKTKMVDTRSGGFFGRVNFQNEIVSEAPKGLVLNARILWTFSRAAQVLPDGSNRVMAQRAYEYLIRYFTDREYHGMYWMVDDQGKPLVTKKQIYAQAFAIYGLSEFYQLSNDPMALEQAMRLFECIEKYSFDQERNGYLEAFDQQWHLLEDLRLSDKDANEVKTMNTHLHLLEAYTNLYSVSKNGRVRKQLLNLLELFMQYFLNPQSHQYYLFFNEKWQLRSGEVSYGHDIETAWLLQEAAEALEDDEWIANTAHLAVATARATLPFFDEDGGLFYNGNTVMAKDRSKHWWPQAEAMVGMYHAFQVSGEEVFRRQAEKSWQFIRQYLIDQPEGEWIWGLSPEGQPLQEDKAGPWKCPYHNGRAMMEMMRRLPDGGI